MTDFTRFGSLGLVAAAQLTAPCARADDRMGESAPTFSRAGQVVIAGSSQLGIEHISFSTTRGSPSQPPITSLSVAPSVDVFVVRGLSVGARVAYGHTAESGTPSSDSLSIGPRVGYNIALGDHLSFWPDVSVAGAQTWMSTGGRIQAIWIGGYAPVLYHPAAHLFVGLGPSVSADVLSSSMSPQGSLTDGPLVTEFGVLFTMGGWVAP